MAETDYGAFSPPTYSSSKMKPCCKLRPAGQDEMLHWLIAGIDLVNPPLDLRNMLVVGARNLVFMLAFVRRGQVCADIKQARLQFKKYGQKPLVQLIAGITGSGGQAHAGVKFING